MAVRTRSNVWDLSVAATGEDASTATWHPVLDAYARGVDAMGRRPHADPRSWRFAANTHQYPSDEVVPPGQPLWGQCAHQKFEFLAWHRAYLVWFEDSLRAAIGDDSWALPYWDYTDPDLPERRQLPPEFLVEHRTVDGALVDNPLYTEERAEDFRRPDPATGVGLLPEADVDPSVALARPRFLMNVRGGFGGFPVLTNASGVVEMLPHNMVHSDLGDEQGRLMGNSRYAARDPIFWLHHANIDRLWEVWRSFGNTIDLLDDPNVSAAIKTRYRTADHVFGLAASPVKYTTVDLMDTRGPRLEYEYDTLGLSASLMDAIDAERDALARGGIVGFDDAEAPWTVVGATGHVEIDAGGSEFDVPGPPAAGFDQLSLPSSLVLHLENVTAESPASGYVVEVAASPGAPRRDAGRFATFGLATATAEGSSVTYVIDATKLIADLGDDGWTGGQLTVVVRPARDEPDVGALDVDQVTMYHQ